MLLLQYYVYMKFSLLPDETSEQKDFSTKYSLPAVNCTHILICIKSYNLKELLENIIMFIY